VALATPEFSIFNRYIDIFLLFYMVYICKIVNLYHKNTSSLVVNWRFSDFSVMSLIPTSCCFGILNKFLQRKCYLWPMHL
jgi:hypothetical protein